ncbi:hypothetical protein N657DRAFT_667309 [Parathielavia appendiculata]|uniref:SET domain-containing protein n=1 Tax=Parathielavia appendiculata TaxID=2587402 RepID=A0AAN6YXU9_9PEZI|nr:hypothetical protein N657DRAFT_667309 [Parathielavia appendiculata]
MTRKELSLARVLVFGLLAPLVAAITSTEGKNKEKIDAPSAGSGEGLAYEPIQKVEVYADNATAPASRIPPVEGWWDSNICSGDFCVYTNWRIAKGRGLVAVTRAEEFQKLERIEDHLNRGENKYLQDPVPFTTTEILNKGPGITATQTIRRGKPLMVWSPVLMVHRSLFDQVPKKKERTRLLEAAISYLPEATQATFNKQRLRPGEPDITSNPRSVEEILLAHPFEIDLGYAARKLDELNHSKHYVNYPEISVLQHDCRANVATYIDNSFALRTTVARRVQAGEELTVTYVDPFLSRAERSAWVKRHRVPAQGTGTTEGGVCPCKACSLPGGEKGEEAVKGEKRLKEILAIRAELRNHDSTKVDFAMIERFLMLYEEERLHVKLLEAYELAALNFNYLGDDKRAKKYADLAVQAGIVEGGVESNDVVAMRVMAKDIKGHYSYRYTLKRRGL